MSNPNKRTAIDPPNTNASKRPRVADLPLTHSSQLAKIHAAVSAATTLLATLASLATTLAPGTIATTNVTQPGPSCGSRDKAGAYGWSPRLPFTDELFCNDDDD